jgi:hypothetical protein
MFAHREKNANALVGITLPAPINQAVSGHAKRGLWYSGS